VGELGAHALHGSIISWVATIASTTPTPIEMAIHTVRMSDMTVVWAAYWRRRFVPLPLAGLALPRSPAIWPSGTGAGAGTGLLWGGPVRIFLVHHVTWSVNSVCHFLGGRRFDTDDRSTNAFRSTRIEALGDGTGRLTLPGF
jgi:fatty-acid desaturase